MKQWIVCLLFVITFAAGAMPQGAAPAKPAAPAPAATPAPPPPSIAASVESQVGIIERELVSAAEAMPDDKFNFAPSSLNIAGSEFKGVRSFAQQVKHVAATNFILWGGITGDKSPVPMKDDEGPESLKTKAEIVKYLKDSYAVGHKAAQSLTAENAAGTLPNPFGGKNPVTRLWSATFAVAHGFDHYGQMVEYLRMNGIVPPASRGQ
jgi:uncharacterized damage-inducible protein DinB